MAAISRGVTDRLEELRIENRSESSYRTGVVGEYRARTMHGLAAQLHDEIVRLTRTQDRICERSPVTPYVR